MTNFGQTKFGQHQISVLKVGRGGFGGKDPEGRGSSLEGRRPEP